MENNNNQPKRRKTFEELINETYDKLIEAKRFIIEDVTAIELAKAVAYQVRQATLKEANSLVDNSAEFGDSGILNLDPNSIEL